MASHVMLLLASFACQRITPVVGKATPLPSPQPGTPLDWGTLVGEAVIAGITVLVGLLIAERATTGHDRRRMCERLYRTLPETWVSVELAFLSPEYRDDQARQGTIDAVVATLRDIQLEARTFWGARKVRVAAWKLECFVHALRQITTQFPDAEMIDLPRKIWSLDALQKALFGRRTTDYKRRTAEVSEMRAILERSKQSRDATKAAMEKFRAEGDPR